MEISLNCSDASSTFHKFTEIQNPSPSCLFVLIDTHEKDIWDATFGVFSLGRTYSAYWLDLPADRHNRGANLSFADGHIEHWKWKAPKIYDYTFAPAHGPDDLADLQRLQECIKPDVN